VPFVGPEAQERVRGAPFLARLGANESVFGPSPQAIAAMEAAAGDVWKYGDPENHDLRHAIAAHHGVPPENVMVGEGIDGLLGYVARMCIEPGDAVVTSEGAYPTFNYHVAGYGGVLHKVPYKGDHEDLDALLEKARAVDAKLIYLANPDNPMGTWHDADRVHGMIDATPAGAVLILDEAYVELAPEGTAPNLDVTEKRVLRMRTFSKAYGMAGARIGYAIGHAETIAAFDRIRNHFGVARISQAGALAALADQEWLEDIRVRASEARDRIAEIGRANGLVPIPSAANFVALDCGGDGARAREVLARLVELGIFIRMPMVAPQDRCIRISCGPASDLDCLEAILPKALL
jgi:histidinol-phosphate aminotransferase